jgi:hypothetical protein
MTIEKQDLALYRMSIKNWGNSNRFLKAMTQNLTGDIEENHDFE